MCEPIGICYHDVNIVVNNHDITETVRWLLIKVEVCELRGDV